MIATDTLGRWARAVRGEEVVALAFLLASIPVLRYSDVPYGLGSVLRGILRAFGQTLWFLYLAAPLVLVVLWRQGKLDRRDTNPLGRENLAEFLRVAVLFGATILAYSNLKAALPRVNPYLFDDELLAVDRALFFGHPPNEFLPRWHPHGVVWLMDAAYGSYFYFFPLTVGVAFFLADRAALRRYIASICLAFQIGTIVYYLLPSLGAIFTHAEWTASLDRVHTFLIRDSLARHYLAVRQSPGTYHVPAFLGIAAFPSLHIAGAAVALATARKHFPLALVVLVPAFGLLAVSTLYFGWHYVVDLVGAVPVAWGAWKLSGRFSRVPAA